MLSPNEFSNHSLHPLQLIKIISINLEAHLMIYNKLNTFINRMLIKLSLY